MLNTNNRASLSTSNSSPDSSSLSVDDTNSPLHTSKPYNNLMKDIQQTQTPTQVGNNMKGESSVNSSFNLGAADEVKSNANKKRRAVAVQNKDNTYWEKRRKNNESAKRSRDMRRCKEEHISVRVIYLEQENLQLRTECALLRSEVEKLRAMVYTQNQ